MPHPFIRTIAAIKIPSTTPKMLQSCWLLISGFILWTPAAAIHVNLMNRDQEDDVSEQWNSSFLLAGFRVSLKLHVRQMICLKEVNSNFVSTVSKHSCFFMLRVSLMRQYRYTRLLLQNFVYVMDCQFFYSHLFWRHEVQHSCLLCELNIAVRISNWPCWSISFWIQSLSLKVRLLIMKKTVK